ncbi:MAG TPA: hypothetical protein VEG35_03255 [Burkholderiales bacterium]|nr:hypothetical protein [Burkholderiales bacterium]
MDEQTIRIIHLTDTMTQDPARVGKMDVHVIYQVGPSRVGTVTIPKETFSEAALEAAVKKDASRMAGLIGKEYKLTP